MSLTSWESANERSRDVRVTGISPKTTKDALLNFFENKRRSGGGEIEDIQYNQDEGIADITFCDAEDTERVSQQTSLNLDGVQLGVRLKSLPNDPRKVHVMGLSNRTTTDGLIFFMELASGEEVEDVLLMEDSCGTVTFKRPPDLQKIQQTCSRRRLDGCFIRLEQEHEIQQDERVHPFEEQRLKDPESKRRSSASEQPKQNIERRINSERQAGQKICRRIAGPEDQAKPKSQCTQVQAELWRGLHQKEHNIRQEIERKYAAEQKTREEIERQLATERQTREEIERQLATERQTREEIERQLATERQTREENERQLATEQHIRRQIEEQLATEQRNREIAESRAETLDRRASQLQARCDELLLQQSCDWILDREEVTISDRTIGSGAWGEVLEGTFRGCKVAVKRIHEIILSPRNRRQFVREMSIASRCRHPCLLQFIGATADDAVSPLFVTELLETSLRAVLHERELEPAEISTIALDVARGVNYLHLNRPDPIIHRDISSGNVLLWRQNNSWRAKVSDYGTANFIRQCVTVCPGTPIYSAPEAFNFRQQTNKIDVYSFGVLLCEMSTPEQPDPLRRNLQVAMVRNRCHRVLIERCLEENPNNRPSMGEVIDALERSREDPISINETS
ncbi:probable serine/threonine-protein kinase DDB_G0271682 [Exaiptasia diaphana]|uniref:Uncharacterized protein n=1 Tax=Exaiptasia diaphana TaxID=2652724 RepID=A0A913WXE8_EXADI|nr:probable serine/threonine-protein kinase DDB_G0271682 [Exaiptasia diaphana]KXJ05535.1 putative serine/threonine-protein kinase drkA [Exaiptasia diaphana]